MSRLLEAPASAPLLVDPPDDGNLSAPASVYVGRRNGGTMSVMTSVIPRGRPFTVDDLEGMPDDGNRYELIDGMLHVSPRPAPVHQVVVVEVTVVARPGDFGPKNLTVAPLLAVEVLSPSTRLYDLNTKRSAYEKMGVASYWIVDPTGTGALTVFELDDAGCYQQVAHVEGDATFTATRPFPVTVATARLLDKLP